MTKTLEELERELALLKSGVQNRQEISQIGIKRKQLKKEIKKMKHWKLKQTVKNIGIIGKNIGVVGKQVMIGLDKFTNDSTNPNRVQQVKRKIKKKKMQENKALHDLLWNS